MSLYLLDTNTISDLVRGHDRVIKAAALPPTKALAISAITEGELQFGLNKRPEAKRIRDALRDVMRRVSVLPWDRAAARCYGCLRGELESEGQPLAALDLLIAAHAISLSATLVSSDKAFKRVNSLTVENWRA